MREMKKFSDYIYEQYTLKEVSERKFRYLLFCEGWPESVQLDEIFKRIREEGTQLPLAIRYQLMCEKSHTDIVFKSIKSDLNYYTSINSMISKLMTKAVTRRIHSDRELNTKLLEYIFNGPDPSSKISIPKMIIMANGMSSELKKLVSERIKFSIKHQ